MNNVLKPVIVKTGTISKTGAPIVKSILKPAIPIAAAVNRKRSDMATD